MKITITVEGETLSAITNNSWEPQTSPVQRGPFELIVEHDDERTLLAQVEGFILSSVGSEVGFPTAVKLEAQRKELTGRLGEIRKELGMADRKLKSLEDELDGKVRSSIRWKMRALEACAVAYDLKGLLAGSAQRWPKGLRARYDSAQEWNPVDVQT